MKKDIVTLSENEYEFLKQIHDDFMHLYRNDFVLKIRRGLMLSKNNDNYLEDMVDIDICNEKSYNIQIAGKNYSIDNTVFNEIKKIVESNLDKLILYSKLETTNYLANNSFDGGCPTFITLKYGQLTININGQVRSEIGIFCNQFKDEIISLILNNKIN